MDALLREVDLEPEWGSRAVRFAESVQPLLIEPSSQDAVETVWVCDGSAQIVETGDRAQVDAAVRRNHELVR